MPFRSEKQRKFLWAKHPDIARRWTEEYGAEALAKKQANKKRANRLLKSK